MSITIKSKTNFKTYTDLKEIFLKAVKSVKPDSLIKRKVKLDNNILLISQNNSNFSIDLNKYENIYVVGTGKATASMAKAIEEILQNRISKGIISVKYGYTENLKFIKQIESGHPVPDQNSILAAKEILNLAKKANQNSLVINLISGGGSALLAYPFEGTIDNSPTKITLEELQKTTELLLSSGATIDEINCIRKHISMIKGGRLAESFYPAYQINLILSDVVGDRLDSIASGITTWDTTTYKDAFDILKKYDLETRLPHSVYRVIKAGLEGELKETPKKENNIFKKVVNFILGSNYDALLTAAETSTKKGYNSLIITSRVTGESKEIAKFYSAIAVEISKHSIPISTPACIISGGETTVTIQGQGKGGRNQEMALSFLLEIKKSPEDYENIYFLAASTDGGDGPTDAAGAFASIDVLNASKKIGLNPESYLKNNNSYTFFNKSGYLLKTGPTNTNVCDIHLAIIL